MASFIPDSVLDVPIDNIKYIKRALFVNGGNDNVYIACFCKDESGKQLPAIKKTKAMFGCHNSGAGCKAPACGFKISCYAVKFIKDGELLRDAFALLDTPVCGTCGQSCLQVTFSSPIKDFVGLAGYTCGCVAYKDRIDIPLEDKSVSASWNIGNYLEYRQKIFGDVNPKLKVLAAQIKVDDEPKTKKVYIPMD